MNDDKEKPIYRELIADVYAQVQIDFMYTKYLKINRMLNYEKGYLNIR